MSTVEEIIKEVCPKCGRVFTSTDHWKVEYAMKEHYKSCILPLKHKVMGVILLPFAFVGFSVLILGGVIYFSLAPIAYPFVYAMKIIADSEVLTWESFTDFVYGKDRVKSYKGKVRKDKA